MVVDRFARRIRTSGTNPATGEKSPLWSWSSMTSTTGLTVNDDTAFSYVPVLRVIDLISGVMGNFPLHVYEEQADGTRQRVKDESTRYLWGQPNPEMTYFNFWQTLFGHELVGNAFIFVVKDEIGQPAEIWPLEPRRMRVGRTSQGLKIYVIDGNDQAPMIDYKEGGEIVHIPSFSRDGLVGINPLSAGAEQIGLGLATEQHAARYFGKDATPEGILTSDQVISPDDSDRIAARWERNYGGGIQRKRAIAVLGSGAKYQSISTTPENSQLLGTRQHNAAVVASQMFGVPPHLLGIVDKSTSWGTGIAEQNRGMLVFVLSQRIGRFESAISSALLVRELTRRYAVFDPGGFLRGDIKQQYDIHDIGIKGGFVTINEARRDLELPPIGGGDKALVPVNMTPIDQLGKAPVLGPTPMRNGATP